jgi:hypothetical protein
MSYLIGFKLALSYLMHLFLSRRNLLSQAEAKYEEEMMLMNNSVSSVSDQRHEASSAPDDLVINMEASPAPLLPTIQEEGSDVSQSPADEEDSEAFVTVRSKLHSTESAAATQNFELEVSVQYYIASR